MPGAVVPSLEEFQELARRGNLIPIYREILADTETPVSAFAKLRVRGKRGFLLESCAPGARWSRYSFLAVDPRGEVRAANGQIEVIWRDVDGDNSERRASWAAPEPTAALAEILDDFVPSCPPGLPPFWGGAVGTLSYDLVRAFERVPARAPDDQHLPDLSLVLTDTLVVFDHHRHTLILIATPWVRRPDKAAEAYASACRRLSALEQILRSPLPSLRPLSPPQREEDGSARLTWGGGEAPRSTTTPEAFRAAVTAAKEYILAGDAFQVVLSQRLEVARRGLDPFDVYRALRLVNPSPYMFHIESPDAMVTGASPECLVRCIDGKVHLRPLAGTRPRGATPADDERLAAELLADPKERAEHVMLIDLGRNDVGRVAARGSVRVTEQMIVERYSHVMHIVSTVEGDLAQGLDAIDVLRAAFPAGTLTGAPKIRAMEIIDELEPHRRGMYGGAVGYLGYGGNLDVAIAIRTLVTRGETITVQAGAGIVYDSDPEAEYQETLNKARGVLRAVAIARGEG